jgi:DNA repair exonuclease SbcCD ATPase subunit
LKDYEFRITWAEKELAHLKEMQALASERQNTTDDRLDRIQTILRDHTEMFADVHATLHEVSELQKEQARAVLTLTDRLDALTGNVDALTGKVDALAGKVDALVEALLRGRTNGKG